MLNLKEYLLVCLGEEGSEVSQDSFKGLRFGQDSVYEGQTRRRRLTREVNEFLAVLTILRDMGELPDLIEFSLQYTSSLEAVTEGEKDVEAKKKRLKQMIHHSVEEGQLDPECLKNLKF